MLLEQFFILSFSALGEATAGGQMEVYSSPDQSQ